MPSRTAFAAAEHCGCINKILSPDPTFGNTLEITVRSSVERQISRQPINQRGCLRSINASPSVDRVAWSFGQKGYIIV